MRSSVAPFRVDVDQAAVDRIRDRLASAHWASAPADDADWIYGTDAAWLRELVAYWVDEERPPGGMRHLRHLDAITAARLIEIRRCEPARVAIARRCRGHLHPSGLEPLSLRLTHFA